MSSDWKIVKNHSSSNKGASYIPPYMRGSITAATAPKELNLSNTTSFPSLGAGHSAPVAPTMNFKQTIKDMISYEQRSEEEKNRETEMLRAKNGYACLKLKIGPSDYLRINENIRMAYEREKQSEMFGEYSYISNGKPPAMTMDELAEDDTYVVLDSETLNNFEPLPECEEEFEDVPSHTHRVGARGR